MLIPRMNAMKRKIAALEVVFKVVEGRYYRITEECRPGHSSFRVEFGV